MTATAAGAGHRIKPYDVSDREMAAGSTFGSSQLTLRIKATGAIERIWSVESGSDVFGAMVLHHYDGSSGVTLTPSPGRVLLHPESQEHRFRLSNDVEVCERIFVLRTAPDGEDALDPAAVYYTIELCNDSTDQVTVDSCASIDLAPGSAETTKTRWDRAHRAMVAYAEKSPERVRIAACRGPAKSYETTHDAAKANAVTFAGPFADATVDREGELVGLIHLRSSLRPRERCAYEFVLTFAEGGERAALHALDTLPAAAEALQKTRAYFEEHLGRALLLTPDAEVNRGALWAKANMLRVALHTKTLGWCFVNDPAKSSNAVARDTAWFAFGADYVIPSFAATSLRWFADHLRSDGMSVEYVDVRTAKTEDYGLSVNDNTPLLVLAIWHHFAVTGDRGFLQALYPRASRMGEALRNARDERGLVWCNATETGARGIVGWRNVIAGYRLSGATTEVNAEAYAAFKTLAQMARELDETEPADRWEKDAAALRDAINEHLLDRSRGLYYLNIDLDGTKRTDVTADLVFPVIFGVADDEIAAQIVSRLSLPEFWSGAGIHTTARRDLYYSPVNGSGLRGGVWPGVSFWYAFAAARFNPEFMAFALAASFRHYSRDPRRNNTVPGQFSEWLHGETLVNQGMMLSPWFPPRYLWAAIEGAGGLDLGGAVARVTPRPAPYWKWLAVRAACVRGREAGWFFARADRHIVAATYPFDGLDPAHIYDEDISDSVELLGDHIAVAAFARAEKLVILAGNTHDRTVTAALRLRRAIRGGARIRAFSSLRESWTVCEPSAVDDLARGYVVEIDRHGFVLFEIEENR